MRVLLAAVLAFGAAPVLAGSTYKWVDADGKVHYTDAPPAQGKVLNRSNAATASGGDENYCQTLHRVAQVVAEAMQQGVPHEEIHSALRSAEVASGQVFRIDPAVQQQLVGYVYSFKFSRTSPNVIAGNIQNRCLNGVYASPRKPRQAADDAAPAAP